jgi:TRAP-type mannitol/chloroaromatic compound transport system permease small subunit
MFDDRAHRQTPAGFAAIERVVRRISGSCALVSGAIFLPLAFYMTVDAASRRLGGPFTGTSDEIASYVLALGGTWALASALASGAHVRIDLLMHLYPPRLRALLDAWALVMTALFAALLAYQTCLLAWRSYAIDARSFSLLGVPLFVPQALTAIGFILLTVQAAVLAVASFVGNAPSDQPFEDQL